MCKITKLTKHGIVPAPKYGQKRRHANLSCRGIVTKNILQKTEAVIVFNIYLNRSITILPRTNFKF